MAKKVLLSASLMMVLSLPFAASEAIDVSGDWNVTLVTPHGDSHLVMIFAQEGESLTVTCEDFEGKGKIEDGSIQWSIPLHTPMGILDAIFKGTIDGDFIYGEVEVSELSMEFSCERSGSPNSSIIAAQSSGQAPPATKIDSSRTIERRL